MFKHILLPTDGSAVSAAGVEKGIELAAALGAKVTALVVVEQFHVLTLNPKQLESSRQDYEATATRHANEALEAARAKAEAAGVPLETQMLRGDHPHEVIVATAKAEGCDLIAMASHGRRGVSAMVLGSQTARVVTHATVPVLVLR
jgi:nucleotide-binding universal stress UspA family protein